MLTKNLVGVKLGSKSAFIDFDPELFRIKSKEKVLISGEIRTFLVAEEGLEPSASVLRGTLPL